eukprot:TRINITY_DN3430_c1_g1_i1.p1 TRINITY_DN3430_c1_g1~~TRINITY_DN3430_c1_g1_i1.p1  ORF type:complete len:432 (+),score=95.03 TRINITY_DN3430_c1_g1_i1:112-1407(+)
MIHVLFFLWILQNSVSVVNCDSFYNDVDYIDTDLSQTEFVEKVFRSPNIWIIEFYAPWCPHCKNFQSDFKMAAENLQGIINFGAIDCDVEDSKPLCGHFKIEGLPTVLAFKGILEPIETPDGQKGFSKVPVPYKGQLKPAQIVKWATSFLSEPIDPVIDITNENFQLFLSEKRSPAKALLFSDKDKKSNLLRSVAHNFRIDFITKYWLPVGQVPHTNTELVERYGITTYPSLIIVDEKGEVMDTFSGEYKSEEMKSFVQGYAYEVKPEDLQPNEKDKQKQQSSTSKPRKAELHHVTSQESFDSSCFQMGLCLISFLDPSSEEHQSYLETLDEIAKKFTSVQVLWMDGTRHEDFKSAFGVAESYPQAVAYQRKAKRYRIFMGGFDVDAITEFIEIVQTGSVKKGRISLLDREPQIVDEEEEEEEDEEQKEDL